MNWAKTTGWPILAAGLWIGFNEFLRNEFLLKSHWVDHYAGLGLEFPSAPVNGMIWMLWSLALAAGLFAILARFDLWRGALLAWFMGYVLMWLVTGNMGVLPFSVLPYGVPWSFAGLVVAGWIIRKLSGRAAMSSDQRPV